MCGMHKTKSLPVLPRSPFIHRLTCSYSNSNNQEEAEFYNIISLLSPSPSTILHPLLLQPSSSDNSVDADDENSLSIRLRNSKKVLKKTPKRRHGKNRILSIQKKYNQDKANGVKPSVPRTSDDCTPTTATTLPLLINTVSNNSNKINFNTLYSMSSLYILFCILIPAMIFTKIHISSIFSHMNTRIDTAEHITDFFRSINVKQDSKTTNSFTSRNINKISQSKQTTINTLHPLPENKVSVIIYSQSQVLINDKNTLLQTLLSHSNVGEIIILHVNPKEVFQFIHPKVINIESYKQNNIMGKSLRFYFCQMVRYDWVIHLDDYIEFTHLTLNEILIEYSKNIHRIVGPYGRDYHINQTSLNGYSSKNTHGETEVILTKFMIMERDICSSFFEYAYLIWEDQILDASEGQLWNGEDIFMSLVSNHMFGSDKINYAMDWLDVWSNSDGVIPSESWVSSYMNSQQNSEYDISNIGLIKFWSWHWWQCLWRKERLLSYRGNLWRVAKERLGELKDNNNEQKRSI